MGDNEEVVVDDEWVTEEANVVDIEQVKGENDGENVRLDGETTNLAYDNITFGDNEDGQHSSVRIG